MLRFTNRQNRRRVLIISFLLAGATLLGHIGYSSLYYLHNLELFESSAFSDSFESRNVSVWEERGEVEFCCDHSKTFIEQAARDGSQALKVTLRRDDPLVAGSKRAELRLKAVGLGKEQWYAFSLLVPDNVQNTSDIVTVAQWHAVDDKIVGERGRAPPLRLVIQNGTWKAVTTWDTRFISGIPFLRSEPQGGKILWSASVDRGVWTSWVFHVKWSYGEDGVVQIWKDGASIVQYKGSNAYNDLIGPFFKVGIYVPAWKLQEAQRADEQISLLIDDVAQSSEPLPIESQRNQKPDDNASLSSAAHDPNGSRQADPAAHSGSSRTP